ncbi:MAG: hypothetical protein HQL50_02865 [Magnetococcales bacterium]|nr:hypothetical protein [Magnetococcales bacterium]
MVKHGDDQEVTIAGELSKSQKSLDQLVRGQRLGGNWLREDENKMFNEDEDDIFEVIALAIAERFSVQIQLDNKIFFYYSHFRQRKRSQLSFDRGGLFLYIHIGALDPPIGNIRIRTSETITLRFFTQRHLLETTLAFHRVIDNEYIKLSFPERLIVQNEKRKSFRVPVNKDLAISAQVLRPAKVKPFKISFLDITSDGFACVCQEEITPLTKDARLILEISSPSSRNVIRTEALFIEHFTHDDACAMRARFLFENYEECRQVEELVAFIQRNFLQRRRSIYKKFA